MIHLVGSFEWDDLGTRMKSSIVLELGAPMGVLEGIVVHF